MKNKDYKRQLRLGIAVESEHVPDLLPKGSPKEKRKLAVKIAKRHLEESGTYYDDLLRYVEKKNASEIEKEAEKTFNKSTTGPSLELQRLLEGNDRYVQGIQGKQVGPARRAIVSEAQHPFACVIDCSDSRVSPEIIFDQGVGDIFVVRSAGNVIGSTEQGSIEYAVYELKVPLVLILGHTGCEAVKAAAENLTEATDDMTNVIMRIKPAVDAAKRCLPHGPEEDMLRYAATINSMAMRDQILSDVDIKDKVNSGQLEVISGMYDIKSGVVTINYEQMNKARKGAEKPGHKYKSRKMVGNHWVYEYTEDKEKHSTHNNIKFKNTSPIFHGASLASALWNIKNNKLKASYINEGKWISFASNEKYFSSKKNNMPGQPCVIFVLDSNKLKKNNLHTNAPKGVVEKDEVIIHSKVVPNLKDQCSHVIIDKKELAEQLKYEPELGGSVDDIVKYIEKKGYIVEFKKSIQLGKILHKSRHVLAIRVRKEQLQKARGHKYIRRLGTPKNYRYIYQEEKNARSRSAEQLREATPRENAILDSLPADYGEMAVAEKGTIKNWNGVLWIKRESGKWRQANKAERAAYWAEHGWW